MDPLKIPQYVLPTRSPIFVLITPWVVQQRIPLHMFYLDSLLTYAVFGIIVGARLFHVVFYDPDYYWTNPGQIIAIWNGGLASHGGGLGIILAVYFYTQRHRIGFGWLLDRLAIATALFGFFVRTGNFFNSEIVGKPSDLPLAVIFERVAGFAVIGRLTPVCFAVIFALSGAVGPIIGQNFGAERMDRVKETLNNSLFVTTVYTIVVCVLLYFLQDLVIHGFSLQGDAAIIVAAFCTYVAITFIFNGALFVANTSFNNLGKPLYSTALNLGKATLGTLPFVYLGSQWYGALGVLYGQALGNILFGLLGVLVLRYHISELMQGSNVEPVEDDVSIVSLNTQPFCSHDAVLIDDVSANREECAELKPQ